MSALEVIGGDTTNPAGTLTEIGMNTNDSSVVRNAPVDTDIRLIQTWAVLIAAGELRIRSPRLHDNVQGMRFGVPAACQDPLLPRRCFQPLVPQDDLIIEVSAADAAGNIEIAGLLIWYEDLPGIAARLMAPEEVYERTQHIMTVNNTISISSGGDWEGAEALNAEYDLMKANTDYALLGYMVKASAGSIGISGPDTGNLRVGGPGNPDSKQFTANWFVWLSELLGVPAIPVINSANKDGTFVDAHQDEGVADVDLTTIFAELG